MFVGLGPTGKGFTTKFSSYNKNYTKNSTKRLIYGLLFCII